ncbi:MAG: tetratricopeptide repeat protein [Gemmataceae bacterium]
MNDLQTLKSMNNLACSYRGVGRFKDAVDLGEMILPSMKVHLKDHPSDVLICINNLGIGYAETGRFAESVKLFEEFLAHPNSPFGPDSPETLRCVNNLGLCYHAMGKMADALPHLEKTLRKRIEMLTSDDPDLFVSMNNLARGYEAIGKKTEALHVYSTANELMKKKLGANHSDTIVATYNVGSTHYMCGQLNAALSFYLSATNGVAQRQFQHPNSQLIIENCAEAYEQAGDFLKAEAWRRKWLAHVQKSRGPDSPDTARAIRNLAQNLVLQKKWAEAEKEARAARAILFKMSPESWARYDLESMLGEIVGIQGQPHEAEQFLVTGYDGLRKLNSTANAGPPNSLRDAGVRLIDFYMVMQQPTKADEYRKTLPREVAPAPQLVWDIKINPPDLSDIKLPVVPKK